jgi:hypothetical protein
MSECANCRRQSDLFGCKRCQDTLRGWFYDTPGWITALLEAVHGETRLGESVRRSSEKTSPMLCNLDASAQLAYARSVLNEWTRDLCETRGLQTPDLVDGDLAIWLAHNVTAIACDQGFGVCFLEVKQMLEDIEHLVDRPKSPALNTSCPAMLTVGYGEQVCGAYLTLLPEEDSVRCHNCKATHQVHELTELRLDAVPNDLLFTATEILDIMAMIRRPIPESTWRRWRQLKQVMPAGELYGEPAYRIQDVRDFRKKWTRDKAS